jgi:hypothetical protein
VIGFARCVSPGHSDFAIISLCAWYATRPTLTFSYLSPPRVICPSISLSGRGACLHLHGGTLVLVARHKSCRRTVFEQSHTADHSPQVAKSSISSIAHDNLHEINGRFRNESSNNVASALDRSIPSHSIVTWAGSKRYDLVIKLDENSYKARLQYR